METWPRLMEHGGTASWRAEPELSSPPEESMKASIAMASAMDFHVSLASEVI